jgi:hypothetical protein
MIVMKDRITKHMDARMNQRGLTADQVRLVLGHGEWVGDRCRLNRQGLQQLISACERTRADALRLLDKGGAVVVEDGGALITTYPLRRRELKHR